MRIIGTKPVNKELAASATYSFPLKQGDVVWIDDYEATLHKHVSGSKWQIKWAEDGHIETKSIKGAYTPFTDAQNSDDRGKIAFLEGAWHRLNKEKFGGKMRLPNIGIMRSVAVDRFRHRGYWLGGDKRQLKVNRHLFKNESGLYETFLHEMCHQYVSEVLHVYKEPNGGHGPNWTKTMKMVGLPPNRYDPDENSAYMDEEEKKIDAAKKQAYADLTAGLTAIPKNKLKQDMLVRWPDRAAKKWRYSILVMPRDSARKRWITLDKDDKLVHYVPSTWFYEPELPVKTMMVADLTLPDQAKKVRDREIMLKKHKRMISDLKKSGDLLGNLEDNIINSMRNGNYYDLSPEDRWTMRILIREELKASFKEGVRDPLMLAERAVTTALKFYKQKTGQ